VKKCSHMPLAGARFGRLTVEGPAPHRRRSEGPKPARWCLCDCGERVSVAVRDLHKVGGTRSCGCLVRETAQRRRLPVPVGERFGRFTVEGPGAEGPGDSRWLCRCDCGQVRTVYADSLKSGHTRSCGCLQRPVPPVGERFGALVVQGEAEPDARRKSRWVCLCDCGRTVTIRANNLRARGHKPCGCARRRS